MRKSLSKLLLLAMLLVVAGCGRSDKVPLQTGSESGLDIGSLPVSQDSAPGVVVSAFLDALRGGDAAIAEQHGVEKSHVVLRLILEPEMDRRLRCQCWWASAASILAGPIPACDYRLISSSP